MYSSGVRKRDYNYICTEPATVLYTHIHYQLHHWKFRGNTEAIILAVTQTCMYDILKQSL